MKRANAKQGDNLEFTQIDKYNKNRYIIPITREALKLCCRDEQGIEHWANWYGRLADAPKLPEQILALAKSAPAPNAHLFPEAELEARESYDPIVDAELERFGLTRHWFAAEQQKAKQLLSTNQLNIHTVQIIEVVYSKSDSKEVFFVWLMLDFFSNGYFGHDPARYIRCLRIPPAELEQIPGLRSWLRTRWMEMYPKKQVPDCLKDGPAVVAEKSAAAPNPMPDDEIVLEHFETWLSTRKRRKGGLKGMLTSFVREKYGSIPVGEIEKLVARVYKQKLVFNEMWNQAHSK